MAFARVSGAVITVACLQLLPVSAATSHPRLFASVIGSLLVVGVATALYGMRQEDKRLTRDPE